MNRPRVARLKCRTSRTPSGRMHYPKIAISFRPAGAMSSSCLYWGCLALLPSQETTKLQGVFSELGETQPPVLESEMSRSLCKVSLYARCRNKNIAVTPKLFPMSRFPIPSRLLPLVMTVPPLTVAINVPRQPSACRSFVSNTKGFLSTIIYPSSYLQHSVYG